MERRHAPDAVDATGKLIADCYCPRCDHFSGGGLCRVCKRELAIEAADNENAIEEDNGPASDAHAATPEPGDHKQLELI